LIDRNRRSSGRDGGSAEENSEETEIVRIKQFVMKPMTVEEAMLQMELVGHDFYFFHNAATGRESVLYRRRDGRLGLIEPA
jgi:putative sigma-54 modulation protein